MRSFCQAAGLMLRGRLFTGTHSSGGEFGHMVHIPTGAVRCGRAASRPMQQLRSAAQRARRDRSTRWPISARRYGRWPTRRGRGGPERAAFRAAGRRSASGSAASSLFDPAPVAIVGHGALPLRQSAAIHGRSPTAGGMRRRRSAGHPAEREAADPRRFGDDRPAAPRRGLRAGGRCRGKPQDRLKPVSGSVARCGVAS